MSNYFNLIIYFILPLCITSINATTVFGSQGKNMKTKSVHFTTGQYSSMPATFSIDSTGNTTLYIPGNEFRPTIKAVGVFKGTSQAKSDSDLLSAVDYKDFYNASAQESMSPGDSFLSLSLMEGEKIVAYKLYAGQVQPNSYMTELLRMAEGMALELAKQTPEVGFTVTAGDASIISNETVHVLVYLTNVGQKKFSLATPGNADFNIQATIANSKTQPQKSIIIKGDKLKSYEPMASDGKITLAPKQSLKMVLAFPLSLLPEGSDTQYSTVRAILSYDDAEPAPFTCLAIEPIKITVKK